MMDICIVSAFIVGAIIQPAFGGFGWCKSQLSPMYSPEHNNVSFQFSVSLNNKSAYTFRLELGNGISQDLLQVFPGNIVYSIPSISYIGDVSTGNISFVYRNVNRSEAGVYTLMSILGPDHPTQCVSLFILGTPNVPTVSINRRPDEGEDAVLTCSGSRSTTVPTSHNLTMVYSWIVDEVINPDIPRYKYNASSGQFTITNVQSTDTEKQITCRATEDVTGGLSSANSSVVSVQIYYGPENIKFDPEDLTYDVNESSQFGPVDCTANCFPACTYRWDKEDAGQTSNNGTLYINRMARNDAGTYICLATNPGRIGRPQYTDTKQLDINVMYAATIDTFKVLSHTGVNVAVYENDPVNFLCTVDSYPASIMTIKKSDMTLKTEDNTKQVKHFVSRANCSDRGVYTCIGFNGIGVPSSQNIQVNVNCSPRLSKSMKVNISRGLDDAAAITVDVVAFPIPSPTDYTWSKLSDSSWTILESNSSIHISSNQLQSSLTIYRMTESDYGSYMLTVCNGIGDTMHEVFGIIPNNRPLPPGDLRYLQVTDTTAVIVWNRGFDGGFNQTFHIESKEVKENIWKTGSKLDTGEHNQNFTITSLSSSTSYNVRVYANNVLGNSTRTKSIIFTTSMPTSAPCPISYSDLVGSCIGAMILSAVLSSAVCILQRRYNTVCCTCLKCKLLKTKDTDKVVEMAVIADNETDPAFDRSYIQTKRVDIPYEALQHGVQDENAYLDVHRDSGEPIETDKNMDLYVNLKM